jgi:GNAT superfamily N-acetyltransferase
MPINTKQMGLAMNAWQAMTPEQQTSFKPQMRQMMDEYRTQQQEAWSRARSYYTAADHGLGKERFDELTGKLANTTDPTKSRQSLFNDELVSLYSGIPANMLENKRGGYMQAIAEKELGHQGPIDDAAFFSGMQGLYKMEDEMQAKVLEGAVAGQSAGAIWQGLSQANAGKPGWKQKERDYAKRVYLQAHELKTMADRLRPVANRVAGRLEGSQGDLQLMPALEELRGLNDRELAMVYELMAPQGQAVEGAGEQMQETGRRAWTGFFTNIARGMVYRELDFEDSLIKEGAEVSINAKTPQEMIESAKVIRTTRIQDAQDMAAGTTPEPITDTRQLSAEEAKQAKAFINSKRQDLQTLEKLRKFEEARMSPMGAKNPIMDWLVLPAAESQAVLITAAIPWLGIAGSTMYYEQEERSRLLGLGVGYQEASKNALATGIAQAAAERMQALLALGKMPGTKKALDMWLKPGGNMALRGTGYIAANVAGETGTELLQDFIIPAAVQDITQVGGDVTWLGPAGTVQTALDAAPRTAAGVFLFGLVGSGVATVNDIQGARDMVKDRNLLLQSKFSEAQADEILSIQDPRAAIQRARDLWGKREGTPETMRKAAKAVEKTIQKGQLAEQELEQLGLLPIMGRDPQTGDWYVRGKDGAAMPFGSYEEANAARWQEVESRKVGMHQAIRETLEMDERKLQPGEETKQQFSFREITQEQQVAAAPGDAETLKRRRQQSDVLDDGYEMKAYRAANAVNNATAPDAAAQEATALVIGRSYTEFADGIRRRVMELNQGATPLTVVEESVEDDARKLLTSGKRDWLLANLRELEAKIGKLFVTENDAEIETSDIVEAYSHVAVSYFAMKSRKGEGKFKNNKGWLDEFRAELRTMGIKRLLDATATKLYAMFRRAAKLGRLSQKGQINPEFEAQLAQSLGLEQALHEAGVVKEAGSLLKEANGERFKSSYSLGRMPASDKTPKVSLSSLPRDMREEMFNNYAMFVNPDATEAAFFSKKVPSGTMSIAGLKIDSIPDGQLKPWNSAAAPPIVIADGKLIDGQHRIAAALKAGESRIKYIDISGLTNVEEAGYISDLPSQNDASASLLELESKWKKAGISAHLSLKGKDITLSKIVIPEGQRGQGLGTAAMQELAQFADSNGFRILLTPSTDYGASSVSRLENFYSRFGFKRNAGKSRDFSTRETMIREPQEATYSLAPGKGTLDDRLAKMFDPFQKSPELRQKVGLLAQQRLSDPSAKWRDLIAANRTMASIERERLKRRDAQYADLKTSGATDEEAKTISERDSKSWAKIQQGAIPDYKGALLPALRTLDAILSALPAEVRGKIGGYVKLAELSTDEARLQEIEKRVERMDRELEKWLRKDIREQIEDLFEKAKPKKDKAGKTPKGKLGADGHHIFQQAEIAAKADAATVQAMIAALDVRLADPNITPEQEVLLEREREVVALVGDMKNAEAGRLAAAYTALNEFFQESWSKWKIEQTAKKERRKLDREELQADTGSDGARAALTERRAETATLFGKAKGWAADLSSFVEVLRVAFGADSKVASRIADAERNASNQYEDAIQDTAQEVQDLFTQLAGGNVLRGEQLRFDMSRPTIKAKGDKFSELEAITALLMWRQEDGRRHMEGAKDENGKPVSSWSYDQAFIDELDNALSPEARQVMSWLIQKYAGEYDTLNPLYRARHGVDLPRNANYSPITVKPMQTQSGEVVDPVTGVAVNAAGIFTPGSLRTRSRVAIAKPDFRDALQTFLGHNKQMEWWKAYYELAVDMRAVLGNREVMDSVQGAIGEEGSKVLGKWLDVFAAGGTRDAAAGLMATEWARRLVSRAATVALLGRVSTLLVQSTQLAAASVKMPVGAYLKRFGKLMAGQLSWGDAIKSDFIQRRIQTAPPIVRQAMEGLGVAKRPNQISRAVRFLGNLLSGADGLFTGGTYAILLDYHREMGAKMGMTGQELETYAHTEAQKATEDVAQPVRMGARSIMEVTHTNPLARMMWAYASEARQKITLFGWGFFNAKKDPAYFAKTAFLTFIVGGLGSQILKNVWRELKGDDDEEKWSAERLVKATVAGPLHGVPLFSELTGNPGPFSSIRWTPSAMSNLLEGDYDSPTDAMRDIETLLSAAGHFNDTAAGVAALSHLGVDFAKLLEHTADDLE